MSQSTGRKWSLADDREAPLRPDMLLKAAIEIDRRPLLAWIGESVFGVAQTLIVRREIAACCPRFRYLPLVRQAETTECGHACLAMIACWFGHEIDLVSLRLHQSTSGTARACMRWRCWPSSSTLRARALRLEPEDLARSSCRPSCTGT